MTRRTRRQSEPRTPVRFRLTPLWQPHLDRASLARVLLILASHHDTTTKTSPTATTEAARPTAEPLEAAQSLRETS